MKKNFAAQTQSVPSAENKSDSLSACSRSAPSYGSTPIQKTGASYHPGLIAFFALLLLLPGAVAAVLEDSRTGMTVGTGSPETAVQTYDSVYTDVTQLDPILVGDNLIVTYQIDKTGLADVSYSLEAQATFGDDPEYDFVNLASIGFETPQIFVSAVLPADGHSESTVLNTEILTDYEETYVSTPDDYSYLTEDGEDFLSQYRSYSPENYYDITLDSDGLASKNGIVTFTVSNPSTNYLSGAVNIVYKKDGQPVFGDVYSFYASASNGTKAFAYTPRCELPDYDTVELINMHD